MNDSTTSQPQSPKPKDTVSAASRNLQGTSIARVSTTITAPTAKVWDALVNPETIKKYMFGTNVVSDWREGSPIVWKGEWKGKAYEDKGVILRLEPQRVLQYSHFSPLSGLAEAPENYHQVTIELSNEGASTRVSLAQDNNPTEQAREQSEKNWGTMLTGLKKLLEQGVGEKVSPLAPNG